MQLNNTTRHSIRKLFVILLGMLLMSAASAADLDSRIFEFQQKLANSGNVQAQYKLAFLYETGRGVDKDLKQARVWYTKAASQKYKPAQERLHFLDVIQSGFKPADRIWINDLTKDARNGDGESMFILAELYENGIGFETDLKKARDYYKQSTAKGNPNAESRLYKIEQRLFAEKKQDNKAAAAERQAAEAKQKQLEQKETEQQNKLEAEQRALQLKAAQEQKRLAAERKKLAEEKRNLEAQKKELAEREAAARAKAEQARLDKAAAEKASAAAKKDDVFESDTCTGAAARFRTQCQ